MPLGQLLSLRSISGTFRMSQLLESHYEQYQKAKEKGQTDLTSITTTTSTALSIHADTLSTFPQCSKCGYSHPLANAQLWDKSVTPAMAAISTLPFANAKSHKDHHTTPEAQKDTADHPGTTGQFATKTTGVDPANPPADACAATH